MCSLLVAFSLVFRLVYSSLLARLLCLIYTGERRATIRTSRVTSICFPHVSLLLLLLFSLSLHRPFHSFFPFRHSPPLARFIGINRIELHTRSVFFSWFRPVTKRKKERNNWMYTACRFSIYLKRTHFILCSVEIKIWTKIITKRVETLVCCCPLCMVKRKTSSLSSGEVLCYIYIYRR